MNTTRGSMRGRSAQCIWRSIISLWDCSAPLFKEVLEFQSPRTRNSSFDKPTGIELLVRAESQRAVELCARLHVGVHGLGATVSPILTSMEAESIGPAETTA
jgi:hypothetical protein